MIATKDLTCGGAIFETGHRGRRSQGMYHYRYLQHITMMPPEHSSGNFSKARLRPCLDHIARKTSESQLQPESGEPRQFLTNLKAQRDKFC
jgi:hypothetical protein